MTFDDTIKQNVRSECGQCVYKLIEQIRSLEDNLRWIAEGYYGINPWKMKKGAKVALKGLKESRLMADGKKEEALDSFWNKLDLVNEYPGTWKGTMKMNALPEKWEKCLE